MQCGAQSYLLHGTEMMEKAFSPGPHAEWVLIRSGLSIAGRMPRGLALAQEGARARADGVACPDLPVYPETWEHGSPLLIHATVLF